MAWSFSRYLITKMRVCRNELIRTKQIFLGQVIPFQIPEIWLRGIEFWLVVDRLQFVSLSWPDISIECNILGSCYEAFAMYSFSRYLIACLGMLHLMIQRNGHCTSLQMDMLVHARIGHWQGFYFISLDVVLCIFLLLLLLMIKLCWLFFENWAVGNRSSCTVMVNWLRRRRGGSYSETRKTRVDRPSPTSIGPPFWPSPSLPPCPFQLVSRALAAGAPIFRCSKVWNCAICKYVLRSKLA